MLLGVKRNTAFMIQTHPFYSKAACCKHSYINHIVSEEGRVPDAIQIPLKYAWLLQYYLGSFNLLMLHKLCYLTTVTYHSGLFICTLSNALAFN
jgi:hypothetical protein